MTLIHRNFFWFYFEESEDKEDSEELQLRPWSIILDLDR